MTESAKNPAWWTAFVWLTGLTVLVLGYWGWYQNLPNGLALTSLYQLFPILGIWAWSIMWTHYLHGEVRRFIPPLNRDHLYHLVSTRVVLLLLLLHPGILAIEQFRQGKGLPPMSFLSYAGEVGVNLILLGIVGLLLFLFFEFILRFETHPKVQQHWWLVNITQSVAMLAIFYHGLNLGSDLHAGWFRDYWVILGLLLAPCLIHTHWDDFDGNKQVID